jgi:RHS repeat-associated protein
LVRQIVDGSGELVFAQSYEPYGDVLDSYGEEGSHYGFTGEMQDPTGLVYLRARYYNTGIGIFTAKDPFAGIASIPRSFNPYMYANNNPLLFTDPSGRFPQIIALSALGGLLGGVASGVLAAAFYDMALTGDCGCDMWEEAISSTKGGWVAKFAAFGALIRAVATAVASSGPVGMIVVGSFGVAASTVDLIRTTYIMVRETGFTPCIA